jgi:hypothetical protein
VFIFCSNAFAQKIEYSAEPIDNYDFNYMSIAGFNDSGFFLLQSNMPFDEERDRLGFKSRKYKISYFTSQLQQKWTNEFDKGDEDSRIETIGVINGKVVIIKTKFKANENKLNVLLSRLNQNGQEVKEPLSISEISFEDGSKLDKVKFISSLHHTMFGLIQVEKKENKTQVLNCIVMDTTMKPIHTIRFDIPYEEKNFYFTNWLLTDEGDFILLGYLNTKEKSVDKKRWDAYKLFVAKHNYNQVKEFAVNTPNIVFSGDDMVYDALHNKVMLAGFYLDKFNYTSGIMYGGVKLSTEDTLEIKKQSIAEGYKAKLLYTKNNDYKAIELDNYTIEKIILRNDGGAVLVAEASYVSDYSYYDYFTQSYIRQSEFHFENVMVLSLNADGTIDWDAILRKDQASINDEGRYSSFCLARAENKISLFYNTSIERTNRVAVFSVTNTGEADEKDFISAEEKILLIPDAARQITSNEIIVPCWSRRKLLLAKISF